MKFEVGDKVEILWGKSMYLPEVKNKGTVIGILPSKRIDIQIGDEGEHTLSFYPKALKLIKPEPKTDEVEFTLPVEIKELILKNMALFIKQGYITHKFEITAKGKNRLLTIIKELKK